MAEHGGRTELLSPQQQRHHKATDGSEWFCPHGHPAGTWGCSAPDRKSRPSIIDVCCFLVPFSTCIIYGWLPREGCSHVKKPKSKAQLEGGYQSHPELLVTLTLEKRRQKKAAFKPAGKHPGSGGKAEKQSTDCAIAAIMACWRLPQCNPKPSTSYEDQAAITQPPHWGLRAPLGAAGSHGTAASLSIPLAAPGMQS